jgi:hypothetical protein
LTVDVPDGAEKAREPHAQGRLGAARSLRLLFA